MYSKALINKTLDQAAKRRISKMQHIYGIGLDNDARCVHYHTSEDVVAMKCAVGKNIMHVTSVMMNWNSIPSKPPTSIPKKPALCGHCRKLLSYRQYSAGKCPFCSHLFNPKCSLHHNIYFSE